MRKTLISLACLALMLAGALRADACTNVIITKGASADGSCMVTYAADSHQLFGELYFHRAADWPAGSMKDIYDWDGGFFRGRIPQIPHTYQTVGNMNEHQLVIMETTFGGRDGLENKDGIMDYGSLIYTTLQRARTAREAIRTIDFLVQTYGYPSAGESFSIVDKDECWIFEIVGKGEQKGAVWVAVRIPDGSICAHANQSRIHHFPLNDPENCIYSPDVISFAREKGFFQGKDEEFSFCDAYCPADWGALRGCEARVWSAFRLLGGSNFDADSYLDFARGENPAHKMPLCITPEKKVTVKALADVMRDHYEGTPLDFSEDVGAGVCRTPYRWRPMDFELDGKEYMFERSIATQQTGFWYLAQARNWLPDEVGGLLWFGVDDAATSALTPIYTCISSVPECFREGNGTMLEYSPTSAFWLFNRVAQFSYLFYDRVIPEIRGKVDAYENENVELVASLDRRALKMLEGGNREQAVRMLTEWCAKRSQYLFDTWNDLSNYLLVKFMDGNVKRQNPDGSFQDNGSGKPIPESPMHPKFRERWLRAVVKDHGDVIEIKK
ncbi:MAG: C69 family dipeptidase [Bacteroidales bacterium]|nr:C69 family dipeptidase [Bacteroidales bacterium]